MQKGVDARDTHGENASARRRDADRRARIVHRAEAAGKAADATDDTAAFAFLLEFFKALSDGERLRIAGLLAAEPLPAGAIAARLGVPPVQTVRQLARLERAGIVCQRDDGCWAFAGAVLREWVRRLSPSPRMQELAGATDQRSRVLAAFFRDGRLLAWPTGDARKLIVLGEIAARFEPGRTYTEREVNDILRRIADDYATLRRALVDYHFMNRHRGVYWLGEGRPRSA
jgi:DNA-binding MarR family transcriptional regulator